MHIAEHSNEYCGAVPPHLMKGGPQSSSLSSHSRGHKPTEAFSSHNYPMTETSQYKIEKSVHNIMNLGNKMTTFGDEVELKEQTSQ